MEEFELQIKQGSITVNLDNLKAELKEISDKYKNIIIKEDEVALAKKDLARLRKIRKSVDDRRKEVKAEWEKPLKEFETEVKEALSIIDAPISEIDGIVKDYESQAKADKEQHCRELFDANVGEYAEYIEFGDVFKDSWLNKSSTDTEIISDISGARLKAKTDLDAIKALNSEFEAEVIAEYKKTRELSSAIQRNTQLISAKQLAEKKAEEEAQARIEAERRAREEAEKRAEEAEKKIEKEEPPIDPLPFETEDYAVFTVKARNEEEAQQIRQFCELSEIEYSVIKR